MSKNRVLIFDTTLRDGEQCPGASMNLREKLAVARQLGRLKVDVIEAGFPVISEGDFSAVQSIAKQVKGPQIAGLARCVPGDIDAAGAAVKPAGKRGRIHVFLATSKIHREHKLGTITCSACQAKYTKEITPLDEAIDVYSEWIDMCAAPPAARCASPCIIACIARACRAIRLPPPPPAPPPRTAAAARGRMLTRAHGARTQVGGGEHGRGPRPRRRPAVGGGARGGRGPRGRAP